MELLNLFSEQYTLCLFVGLREVGGKTAKDTLLVGTRFQLTVALYVKRISFNFTVYIRYILDKWVPILKYLVSRLRLPRHDKSRVSNLTHFVHFVLKFTERPSSGKDLGNEVINHV